MNIAIIPARAGSKRIPGKNIRLFHGKPIIAYSIEAARETDLFSDIVVSTDSAEYAQVAKAYGAKVHMRAKYLSDDQTGTQEVARAVLLWYQAHHPAQQPELACCIYATAPLLTAGTLRNAFGGISCSQGIDFVYAIAIDPIRDIGQFYWGWADAFIDRRPLEGPNARVLHYAVGKDRAIDINTEEDWQRAERMYQELQEQRIEQEARQP